MRVILLADVAKLGRRHEIKEVADGYGRNFIVARGLGMIADQKNLLKLAKLNVASRSRQTLSRELLIGLLDKLAETKLIVKAKANPAGHLFAQIHPADIAKALAKAHFVSLQPEQIILKQTIKTIGEHQFQIKFPDHSTSTFLTVEVRPS